jgi:hypothetical protein
VPVVPPTDDMNTAVEVVVPVPAYLNVGTSPDTVAADVAFTDAIYSNIAPMKVADVAICCTEIKRSALVDVELAAALEEAEDELEIVPSVVDTLVNVFEILISVCTVTVDATAIVSSAEAILSK